MGAQTASAAVCQRMWWSSCPLRPSRTSCPHEKRRRAGEPRRGRPSRPVSLRHSIGCLHVAGIASLVSSRSGAEAAPYIVSMAYIARYRLLPGTSSSGRRKQFCFELRQAALGASPVAARLGPSPRGLARCTGRPLEHVLCARGRVTSRSHSLSDFLKSLLQIDIRDRKGHRWQKNFPWPPFLFSPVARFVSGFSFSAKH